MSTSEKSNPKENSRAALKLPKGITRCTNGRFQARYTSNGHRYSLYGWDLEELERRLKEAKEESLHKECVNSGRIGRADTEEAQGGMALDEWYEIWLREYKAVSVKQGTVDSYRCIYEYYIRPELGQMCLTRIKGQDLQMFYNNMSRQGYSKATMSLTSVVLGSMLSQAFKNELIPKNPALLCTLPRNSLKKAEKAVLTQEQQEILMQYAKKSPLEGIIMLALGTGMRIGEITALEWKDIDFTKMELTVSGTLKQRRSDNTFYKDVPKTEHSRRSIPLLPEMVRVLKMQKAKQKEQRKASGSLWEPVKGLESLVFLRKDGTPVSGQYIRQQLKHLIDEINGNASSAAKRRNGAKKRAVMPYFTPHALRHTFATRAIEKGIPPKVVQELLGHSSITITLDLYTHVLPETKAEEIKKLEKLF